MPDSIQDKLNRYVGRHATLREAAKGWPKGKSVTIIKRLSHALYEVIDAETMTV